MLCIIGMLTVQVSGLIKEMDEKERKYKEICEKYEEKIEIMGVENERLLNDNSKLFEENKKLNGYEYSIANIDSSIKTYMDWKKITNRSSKAWELQNGGRVYKKKINTLNNRNLI